MKQCSQLDYVTEPSYVALSDRIWRLSEKVCGSHGNQLHTELQQESGQTVAVGPARHAFCEASSRPENVLCETRHEAHFEGSQSATFGSKHDAAICQE